LGVAAAFIALLVEAPDGLPGTLLILRFVLAGFRLLAGLGLFAGFRLFAGLRLLLLSFCVGSRRLGTALAQGRHCTDEQAEREHGQASGSEAGER
jgi:hypothetical protein